MIQIAERIRLRTEDCYINSMRILMRVLQIRESSSFSSACIIIKLSLIINYSTSLKSFLERCNNYKILILIFIVFNKKYVFFSARLHVIILSQLFQKFRHYKKIIHYIIYDICLLILFCEMSELNL